MNFDTTYKNLKKRIFDILDEYSSDSDTVFIANGDKEHIASRIPDAVNSSLVRMYSSLAIGRKRAVQRVNEFTPIAYDKGFPDGDKTSFTFVSPVANMAVFFKYFGSGKVSFYNSADKVIGTVDCTGSSTLMTKRANLSLASSTKYKVGVSGSVKITDLCVYENDGRTSPSALCDVDEVSFELPERCDALLEICGKYGRVDMEKVLIEDGFAFVKKSDIGDAESLDVLYTKKADIISESTTDSFSFDLSPLAFEALVCLAASEVCRQEDAAKYTRLVYKYKDLCEGLRAEFGGEKKRNTFFAAVKRKLRW